MKLKSLPIPYKYVILIGFGLGWLMGLKRYLMLYYWGETSYFRWEKDVVVHLVNYTTWALLIPFVYYFISRYRIGGEATSLERAKAIGASILMSAIHETVSSGFYFVSLDLLGLRELSIAMFHHFIRAFPSAFISREIEYWILFAVFTSIASQKKLHEQQVKMAQLESQLSGAQLSALRFQLQPHFLFNTLNTISSLMEINVKKAQKMVSQLGILLRTVLDKNKRNFTELRDELEFIRGYLSIEQMRFNDRLNVRYQIDEAALDAQIPSLILQPLVENAIKHGFASQSEEGNIEVIVRKLNDDIQVIVRDDGQGTEKSEAYLLSTGIGLRNVKDRLELLYGKDHQLLIQSGKNEGFEISIIIPFYKERP